MISAVSMRSYSRIPTPTVSVYSFQQTHQTTRAIHNHDLKRRNRRSVFFVTYCFDHILQYVFFKTSLSSSSCLTSVSHNMSAILLASMSFTSLSLSVIELRLLSVRCTSCSSFIPIVPIYLR